MPQVEPACVIYNPHAGRGRALRVLWQLRQPWSQEFVLRPSRGPGHAEELAQQAAEEGFAVVIAAGGDGTVHEVGNGLLRAARSAIFSTWPIGSTNDYAFSIGLDRWWKRRRERLPLQVRYLDVGEIRTPGGKRRYFLNGLGLGFNGAVTVEARKISWLRGLPLFAWATLKALWKHFEAIPMQIRFDDLVRQTPTLALTMNIAHREGGFLMTPRASLVDGLLDYVHAGPIGRWDLFRHLPNMAAGTIPEDSPGVWLGRAKRVHIHAERPVRIHLDGEFFCHPEDGQCEFTIETLPRRLPVHTFCLNAPAG